ncbi:uncharacterized protein [Parasteatoda tepidariorum]|uniref:uncharacterized protein n=1 Tax=Parasteatoda tepidariorum TaxID=114398 RepID=UPI0039BC82C4
MFKWYRRFLSQRWAKTGRNEQESTYKQSKVGLPQGAVSSCTLFNIYINDLVDKLTSLDGINVCMFADDVVIWTEAENSQAYEDQRNNLEGVMNKALEVLQSWSKENNMIINKNKTVYQFYSLRRVNPDFDLIIDDSKLQKSNLTTYLGVVLDNKLSFTNHISTVIDKVEKRTSILKRLAGAKWGSSQHTLNKTYNTYIKPIIKYGSEVLISSAQDVRHQLDINDLGKKNIPDTVLKTNALCMLQEQYPEPEWTRVYTDGSKIQDSTGAGVHSKLFSHSAPVGYNMSNFDAEISAISIALENLKNKINYFTKAVILVDSKAAIQAVAINHDSNTQTISDIRDNLIFLENANKIIMFQWIPSHVGINGNEKADQLAKKGTLEPLCNKPMPPDSLKKQFSEKLKTNLKLNKAVKSTGKPWANNANIQNSWKKFCHSPRKKAVANFRLSTGHGCLAEHLNRIGILPSSECQSGTMNSDHFLVCPLLDKQSQERGDLCKIYWDARDHMNSL